MPEVIPRYEYRSFAQQFGRLEASLRAAAPPPQIRESEEIYLLSRAEAANIKLRQGQLDIKQRVAVERGLELWRPLLKVPLPLADEDVREALLPALGVAESVELPTTIDADSLCDWFRQGHREVVVVDLFKRRFGFTLENCQAEVAEVLVNGAAIRTVCVEGVDPDAVLHWVDALGLTAFGNINYVQALQRITGLTAEPTFRA